MMKKMNNFSDFYKGNVGWLEKGTIFLTTHGSQAYGTSTPESDLDVKGIAIPPIEYMFGFQKNFEQAIQNEPVDLVIYSLQKFMKLAADCNPNIIEVLFTDKNKWFITTPLFERLYKNRHEFLSMKAKHTFSGYAISQLKRMKTHRNWLLNPPSHKPTREEFGLSQVNKINPSIVGAVNNMIERHNASFDGDVMKLLDAEKRYTAALTHYNQYMNWKKNRNKKRSILEAKIGYDTKNAMHLVRLLKMCKEIITTGEVVVSRPDAKELLLIRDGAWSYEKLIAWANEQEKELDEISKNGNPVLPYKSNQNFLDKLCVELITEFYEND